MKISPEKQQEIILIVSDICMTMGLNQAHDYDGIETEDDLILYLKSIRDQLPVKGICQKYIAV